MPRDWPVSADPATLAWIQAWLDQRHAQCPAHGEGAAGRQEVSDTDEPFRGAAAMNSLFSNT